MCESLCYLEVKTEMTKDNTTAAGTAEKLRPRSVDPSPWKSDMHAEERHMPIEVIEEYRIEEEEPPEPVRKAPRASSRPIVKTEEQKGPAPFVPQSAISPEKRLPQAKSRPAAAEAALKRKREAEGEPMESKPTLQYVDAGDMTTNIVIKEVNLGPSPLKASPSKASPTKSKLSPSRSSPSKWSPVRRR